MKLASAGLRFLNFVLDLLIFSFICTIIIYLIAKIGIWNSLYTSRNIKIFCIPCYFLYYFISEYSFHITPAKLITQTKIHNINKTKKYFIVYIMIRTLARFIPFEGLVIFFSRKQCLHDFISNTVVINKSSNV